VKFDQLLAARNQAEQGEGDTAVLGYLCWQTTYKDLQLLRSNQQHVICVIGFSTSARLWADARQQQRWEWACM
jgi:hypothetical protein